MWIFQTRPNQTCHLVLRPKAASQFNSFTPKATNMITKPVTMLCVVVMNVWLYARRVNKAPTKPSPMATFSFWLAIAALPMMILAPKKIVTSTFQPCNSVSRRADGDSSWLQNKVQIFQPCNSMWLHMHDDSCWPQILFWLQSCTTSVCLFSLGKEYWTLSQDSTSNGKWQTSSAKPRTWWFLKGHNPHCSNSSELLEHFFVPIDYN